MAVKRLEPDFLQKVKVPVEKETLSGSNLYKFLKYRIWIGSTPLTDFLMEGDIWRQPIIGAPDIWQIRSGSTWISFLASQTEAGLCSATDKIAIDSIITATADNITNTLMKRDSEGNTQISGLNIENKYRAEFAPWSSIFTNSATTQKSGISFVGDTTAAEWGGIYFESSATAGDTGKGVLHLIPTKNSTTDAYDHVAISKTTGSTVSNIKLYANGAIDCVSVNTTSARDKKFNIGPTELNAIDFLNNISVVDYIFKDDPKKIQRIGFIADDTDSLISGPEQNQMDHANLLGVLIKANQELSARVAELERRLGE